MARYAFVIAAFLGLFLFPWPGALILGAAAALALPIAGPALGIIADAVYMPVHAFPWGTVIGLLSFGGALLVRHLVRTRIMGA